MGNRVRAERVSICYFAGVHGSSTVDDIGIAASRASNVLQSGRVELTGLVKVEVSLVSFESRSQVIIKIIGEVKERSVNVSETLEILFELC